MAKTDSKPITRRTAITATIAAAAMPAATAAGGGTTGPDPIFAAIEAHRAAYAAFVASVDELNRVEEILPANRRRGDLRCDLKETDDPSWRAAVIGNDEACDAEEAAAWVLVDTEPTTIAGVVALLRYAHKHCASGKEWPAGQYEGLKLTEGWDSELHKSLAASLAKIAAGGVS